MSFYSQYCRHVIRAYIAVSETEQVELTAVETENFRVCKETLAALPSKWDGEMLLELHGIRGATMQEAVGMISEKYGVTEGYVWKKVHEFERTFAQRRGLI